LLRTKSYEVPDLSGVNKDVALNEIAGNDWNVEIERGRSDEFSIPETVIRTDPGPGVMLDEGEPFVMLVSDGPEFRVLPEFAGETIEDAVAALDELALRGVESAERQYSEDVPSGVVIAWQVQGDPTLVEGSEVLPGRTIVLTVSRGPQPRAVPVLVGLTIDEVTATLDGLGLVTVRGEDVFSTDVAVGLVAVQEPAPEILVERGGSVTVQLSKGPESLPLPSLDGQTYPQAQQTLTDAGFTPGSLLGTTEGTFVSMSVDGETVEPGQTFLRGTVVDLVFL
jgi:serine/threonine-protein kinase